MKETHMGLTDFDFGVNYLFKSHLICDRSQQQTFGIVHVKPDVIHIHPQKKICKCESDFRIMLECQIDQ